MRKTYWFELNGSLNFYVPGVPANGHTTHKNQVLISLLTDLVYELPHALMLGF